MKKEKLTEILKENFLNFDKKHKISTTFRITELDDRTFRVLIMPSSHKQNVGINYLVLMNQPDKYGRHTGAVEVDFMKDLIKAIETVGNYFDCRIIFKSDTHTRDFILVKK